MRDSKVSPLLHSFFTKTGTEGLNHALPENTNIMVRVVLTWSRGNHVSTGFGTPSSVSTFQVLPLKFQATMLPRTYPLTKAPKNTFLPPIPRTRRAVVRYLFFTALWCFFFGIAYHVFYSERKQGGSDPFLSFLFGSGTEFQPQGVDSPDTLDLWDVWAVQNLLESGGELLHKKGQIAFHTAIHS
jgi:hypothetical protein